MNCELYRKITIDGDMHPDGGVICSDNVEITNNIFCFEALADKEKGTMYMDATETLPVMSLEGK